MGITDMHSFKQELKQYVIKDISKLFQVLRKTLLSPEKINTLTIFEKNFEDITRDSHRGVESNQEVSRRFNDLHHKLLDFIDKLMEEDVSISKVISRENQDDRFKEFSIFGYLYCINDAGKKEVLVKDEANFPFYAKFQAGEEFVEEAINRVVRTTIEELGVDLSDYQNAGFNRPVYYYMHQIKQGKNRREAQAIPYIFFKIELRKKILGKSLEWRTWNYQWKNKQEIVNTWEQERDDISSFALNVDPKIFSYVKGDMFYEEIGYKLLECVDVLVFRIDSDQKVKFLLIERKESTKGQEGWEYPKGGMEYHESNVEGALREVFEETGIRSNNLKLCGYLDWQTIDVSKKNEFYNTLRVHGLTFHYSGDIEKFEEKEWSIRKSKKHKQPKWVTLEEAKKMIADSWWLENYALEFFKRWEEKSDEILKTLNLINR